MAGLLNAPPAVHRPRCRGVVRLAVVLSLLVCGSLLTPDALSPFATAVAQELAFPPLAPSPPKSKAAIERAAGKQMLDAGTQRLNYDYNNHHKVSGPSAASKFITAATPSRPNRVIYDQTTKRLHAEGNVRLLTEEEGKVTYGESYGPVRRLPRRVRRFTATGHA